MEARRKYMFAKTNAVWCSQMLSNAPSATWNLKNVEGCLKNGSLYFFGLFLAKPRKWNPSEMRIECCLRIQKKLKGVFRFTTRTGSWNCLFTLWKFPTRIVFIHKTIPIAGQLLRSKSNFVLGFFIACFIQLWEGRVLAGCQRGFGFLDSFHLREALFVDLLVKF